MSQQLKLWEADLNCIFEAPGFMIAFDDKSKFDKFKRDCMSNQIKIIKTKEDSKDLLVIVEARMKNKALLLCSD